MSESWPRKATRRGSRRRIQPARPFGNEAKWWDRNRAEVERDVLAALAGGTAGRGTAAALARRSRPSKNITIRMPLDDIERARRLSEKKGIGYQTLMKMLLHEALSREEATMRRRAG